MTELPRSIGWIGLGKMGAPMAQNLLRSGHSLTVWNRTAARAEQLGADGAAVAGDLEAVARWTEIVFTILSDDTALRATLLGPGGAVAAMQPGSVLVEMSTVSPQVSAEIASAARARNVSYLRAPVSGSTVFAEQAKLTFLVSGPGSAYDEVLPLLQQMGAMQFHVGLACEARVLKLVINMMIGTSAAMLGEAMALGLKCGLDRAQMLEVIGASAVASPLVGYKLEPLSRRDYSPAFEARMMAKDFDLILGAAHDSNTPMPLAAQVREGWSAMIAGGDGDADFFKYVEFSAALAGLDTD